MDAQMYNYIPQQSLTHVLIAAGAEKLTPLQIIMYHNNIMTEKLLCELGSDINNAQQNG